jgi:hypothetical protein
MGRLALLTFILAISAAAFAGTPGIFQGRVYQDAKPTPGWIYVQSRNGMMRKVDVSRARVTYSSSVAAADRATDPAQDLAPGAEVRVTAEQDAGGEWRASRVEIIQIQRHQLQSGAQDGPRKAL